MKDDPAKKIQPTVSLFASRRNFLKESDVDFLGTSGVNRTELSAEGREDN